MVQLSWLATQPVLSPKNGTSGMPISIARLGSVQPPDWNTWV